MTQDPRHPGGFEPYQNTNYGQQTMAAPRNSVAAIISLITGAIALIPCIGLISAPVAIISGIIGFVTAGKPAVKGRWMAVVGILLALIGAGYQIAVGAVGAYAAAPMITAVAEITQGLENGDYAVLEKYSNMSAAELEEVKAEIESIGAIQGDPNFVEDGPERNVNNRIEQDMVGTLVGANGSKTVKFTIVVDLSGGFFNSSISVNDITVEDAQ